MAGGSLHDDISAAGRPELAAAPFFGIDEPTRRRLASVATLLWQDAPMVDSAETIPASHLEAFAAAGLYGVFAPREDGGLGLGFPELCAVVEELAGCCLATTFLWVQHFRLLGALVDPATPPAWRERLHDRVIAGSAKGGVVFTGLLPGPPRLTVSPEGGGWALRGEAPWVSGWGIVDMLFVAARGPGDTLVWLLLDAVPQPGLSVAPARLSALNATRTVSLRFEGAWVGDDRLFSTEPYEAARQRSERLRLNGSFALGTARRCCSMIGPSPLDEELASCRDRLDASDEASMPAARAAACELAVRSAHALAVDRGSRSALAGDTAERLGREASLLLVFGSRPGIRDALLHQLHAR
ncbi:MAG TPA: acyl-CoA dehydrogenase family protein [Acidimicrobiales bacterium]|nr:acyl-CoA dehydrogenase family protein [Acidimicrobiales bacterium]